MKLSWIFTAAMFIVISTITRPVTAIDPIQYQSSGEEARFRKLVEEIRCLVCQNQNLADSDAFLAKDLRNEILKLMRNGQSDSQIKVFLTERYGDFVLYRPPFKSATWLLWLGPGFVVAIGLWFIILTIRRRQKGTPNNTVGEEDIVG